MLVAANDYGAGKRQERVVTQMLSTLGFRRICSTSLMGRFMMWAMRADLRCRR